jgi:hypothetical protein
MKTLMSLTKAKMGVLTGQAYMQTPYIYICTYNFWHGAGLIIVLIINSLHSMLLPNLLRIMRIESKLKLIRRCNPVILYL